jgi:hypothetical protein
MLRTRVLEHPVDLVRVEARVVLGRGDRVAEVAELLGVPPELATRAAGEYDAARWRTEQFEHHGHTDLRRAADEER